MMAIFYVDHTVPNFSAKARWLDPIYHHGHIDVFSSLNKNPPAAIFNHIEVLPRSSPKGVSRKITHSGQHSTDQVTVLRCLGINRNVS